MGLQAGDTADTAVNTTGALREALEKVTGWAEGVLVNLPNLLAALVLLLVFWGLGRLVRRAVLRVMDRAGAQPEVNRLIAGAAHILVLVIGLILALGVLDMSKTVTSLLAGAGIVGIALSFAFQDIAENFIAGVILSIRSQFFEGEIVETNDFMGTVERVNLRATVLRTFTGQRVIIPNADVFKKPLVNYSQPGKRRVDVAVGVSYGDDLEEARRVAVAAVDALESRDAAHPVELFYEEFGNSSVNFQVRFWIPFALQTDYLKARSDAIMSIRKAFDEAGITIPFPIRTLDFGMVGGQRLSETVLHVAQARGGERPGKAD